MNSEEKEEQEEMDLAEEVLLQKDEDIAIPKETMLSLLRVVAQKVIYRKFPRIIHHKPPPPVVIKEIILTPKQYEQRFLKLSDYMAAVIAQTYIEQGENAQLSDDEALTILRDLLLDFDETIMLRNGTKRKFSALRRRAFMLEIP